MSIYRKLTDEDKVRIIMLKEEKSLGRISEILNISRQTIYSFILKWNRTRSITRIKNNGRPRFYMRKRIEKQVIKYMMNDKYPTLKAAICKFSLNCTQSTLAKYLKNKKIGYYKINFKTRLSAKHIKERQLFSEKYSSWTENDWKKVIFFDSSSIEFGKRYFNSNWRRRGQRSYVSIPRQYIKRYIKAYAAISFHGKSSLFFYTGRFNKRTFIENISNNWNEIFIKVNPNNIPNFYWLQDNEKTQDTDEFKLLLRRNRVKILPFYPCNSGDLNPLENIWHIFKRKLNKYKFKTEEEIKLNCLNSWNSIDQNIYLLIN